MPRETTVLSLNPDRKALLGYESALRQNGFEIISVDSPLGARFEIEMGRCGFFMSSYVTPLPIYQGLASLFRRYCPNGRVVFLAQSTHDRILDADVLLLEGDEPSLLLRKLREASGESEQPLSLPNESSR